MGLIQRGARLRRSPYFEATWKAGCQAYTVYNHVFLPSRYDDYEAEYWHLLEHVAIWDVAVERNVEITGPDGFEFMQRLTPRDLQKCKVGQGKYVVITDDQGGILNDPVLLRLDEDTFWLALADSDILWWAKGVAVHSPLDVRVREAEAYPLQVQGPKSKPLMEDLFGDRITSLKYYHFTRAELEGIPVLVTRTGWTGEIGYEIYLLDASRGTDLWNRVMQAGRKYNIRATGPSDIRRIEGGFLNYGADMTLDDTPYHVGLGRLVDLDKGDFIGREALVRISERGVDRKLVGIEISGTPIEFNETKWPVIDGGRAIGRVTSAIYSPRLKRNIGYAMVPIDRAEIGTDLIVQHPRGRRRATVARMPFLDPQKVIPKA
ncbi:MAG TPA: glycine cleavage T C-terminal barrel domain-containing protein [Thermoplasmata archaeon]|jgi:aminomethyltransferase|nr:glycine cleavage T C-terminal barrel domain-containing protein [Thermoplasmata archaeon]